MPAVATKPAETTEIGVDAGYRGFLDLAESVALEIEAFQRRIVRAVLGPEREAQAPVVVRSGQSEILRRQCRRRTWRS